MAYDGLIASITLAGSVLSFVATACVLISFAVYHNEQRSFRHALVFNLALSEFINSLNNSISGIFYVRDHQLQPGVPCIVNGFIGQLSVQASDFSILAIALVTLLTITRRTFMPRASRTRKTLICLSVWIVPLVTSIIALVLNALGPVNNNWCWIEGSRTDLRYSLTHGWRFAIIFSTAAIYIYIAWYMAWYYQALGRVSTSTTVATVKKRARGFSVIKEEEDKDTELSFMGSSAGSGLVASPTQIEHGFNSRTRASTVPGADGENAPQRSPTVSPQPPQLSRWSHFRPISWPYPDRNGTPDADERRPHAGKTVMMDVDERKQGTSSRLSRMSRLNFFNRPAAAAQNPNTNFTALSEFPMRRQTRQVEREIKRMLLLNAYPIMYVLLWIPGLVARLLEASGQPSSSKVLATLQSSSQFIGFANAITYGFTKQVRKTVREDFQSLWNRGSR